MLHLSANSFDATFQPFLHSLWKLQHVRGDYRRLILFFHHHLFERVSELIALAAVVIFNCSSAAVISSTQILFLLF